MILMDAGYIVALLDVKDVEHQRATRLLHTKKEGWMTTWPVIAEAVYMLESHVHMVCARTVLTAVEEGDILIWDIPQTLLPRMQKMMKKYIDLPMDLADASMVLLAEHLGHGRILTTDQRDFGAHRWKSQKPFVNLMAQLS
ncbi:MAG: hypothetical protein QM533_01825 [Cytophagales bacterium]|nr:hypothetical protein [Cytophagales bacterium]